MAQPLFAMPRQVPSELTSEMEAQLRDMQSDKDAADAMYARILSARNTGHPLYSGKSDAELYRQAYGAFDVKWRGLKPESPKVIETEHGGVVSVDPASGLLTTLQKPTPRPSGGVKVKRTLSDEEGETAYEMELPAGTQIPGLKMAGVSIGRPSGFVPGEPMQLPGGITATRIPDEPEVPPSLAELAYANNDPFGRGPSFSVRPAGTPDTAASGFIFMGNPADRDAALMDHIAKQQQAAVMPAGQGQAMFNPPNVPSAPIDPGVLMFGDSPDPTRNPIRFAPPTLPPPTPEPWRFVQAAPQTWEDLVNLYVR